MSTMAFTDILPTAPTQYHYVVLEEEAWTCSRQLTTRKLYVAVVLEWYVVAQGDTPEKAVAGVERLLMGYACIAHQHALQGTTFTPPCAAPEDYQRVITAGDTYINPNKDWAAFCGTDRWPVVQRGVIDMTKSGLRVTC